MSVKGLRLRLNRSLDQLVRPELVLFRRRWPAYGVFVVSGIVLGILIALVLAARLGLSAGGMGLAIAAAFAVAVLLALVTRRLLGEEVFTFYHYQVAALAAAGASVALAGGRPLPYLDVLALTVAGAQAWVRIGCLMAGCCHGRPCGWGVRYRSEHAGIGFPHALVGVRLLPTQLLESVMLLALVGSGLAVLAIGRPPGEAMSVSLMGYAVWRFAVEFVRGDRERSFLRGFSEAQWTSALMLTAGAVAAGTGLLPLAGLWLASAAAVVGTFGMVASSRRLRWPRGGLVHPDRIHELADVLRGLSTGGDPEALSVAPTEVRLGATSWGLRISGGRMAHAAGCVHHYSLSSSRSRLSGAAAAAIADLIVRLRHRGAASELIAGAPGVYHLLVRPRTAWGSG